MNNRFIEMLESLPEGTIIILFKHDDGDNVRFHKKKRIRKKWRKRYGVVRTGLAAGDIIFLSEPRPELYMSRNTYATLKGQ